MIATTTTEMENSNSKNRSRRNVRKNIFAFVCGTSRYWFIDSGASAHMTLSESNLIDVPLAANIEIIVRNNSWLTLNILVLIWCWYCIYANIIWHQNDDCNSVFWIFALIRCRSPWTTDAYCLPPFDKFGCKIINDERESTTITLSDDDLYLGPFSNISIFHFILRNLLKVFDALICYFKLFT